MLYGRACAAREDKEKRMSNILDKIQNRNSIAWKKLCDYIDKVAAENRDEFSPLEELGQELFDQIYTLPETISKLKTVKKVWLYGSKLKFIPPEIGEMEALEYFDPYTSYKLHWFPYEITKCKNIKDSRVSTRALYGNFKNGMKFPSLDDNPVRYFGETINCSICGKTMSYTETNQVWISLNVGTDILPLLVNLCSQECQNKLPKPPEGYVQFPHKGGAGLKQSLSFAEHRKLRTEEYKSKIISITTEDVQVNNEVAQESLTEKKDVPVLKLIRKIWEE